MIFVPPFGKKKSEVFPHSTEDMKRVLSRTTTRETVASASFGVGAMSFDLFFSRTTRQKSAFFKTTTTTKMKRGEEEEDVLKSNARNDDHRANDGKEETETKARKERAENAFLESLRRETEENLRRLSDARVPPTRKFSQNEDEDSFSKKKQQRFRNRGGGGEAGSLPKEINGPRGLEPTRFNDWEIGGRCTDF
jgi:hypothetical protein